MFLPRLVEVLVAYPRRPAAVIAGLLALAVVWHLCLPDFFYRSPGVFIDGPLPAIAGIIVALWFWRDDAPFRQVIAACAAALVALLASVLVFGTWTAGPLRSIPALWGELRSGFRLPFSAAVDTWGSAYFSYSLWPALRPILLWGAIAFLVLTLRQPRGSTPLRGIAGRLSDRWAFDAEQRRQMKAYRATYLAAVRGGSAPPSPPTGLMPAGSGTAGLATAHLVLKIGLACAGALGLAGGGWALFGDVLKGPIGAIFARGLLGG